MKLNSIAIFAAAGAICLCSASRAFAQEKASIVWEIPTPSGLANSILGVGWTPSTSARVAFGSTDRWVRVRQTGSGALVYSVLQPHRSGSANQTIYSSDGVYLAVHNSSGGLGYRVHRAADGVFLGTLTVTIQANRVVRFAPDAQLIAAVGGDGTLSRWRLAEFTVVETVGTGYQRTTTVFNFSPNGTYQSAASRGSITIRRATDGSIVRVLAGGSAQGFTPATFTPDNTRIAAWAANPNQTTLWRISDGVVLMRFPGAAAEEGVGAIRFTPDGARLVTTGYLPFVDADGLWQQVGVIRFWRVADGVLRHSFSEHTDLGVTSPVAWSPDATRFAYGTYGGTAVVALTPAP
jgi:WD40 repeat protein